MSQYVSIDYIVKNVMVQLESENNFKKYQTYLSYAIRGMRELGLTSAPYVKTAHLEMLSNKAINLPSDYLRYTKIGICVNGRILTLGLDNSLCLNDNYSECGDPLEIAMANLSEDELENVDGFFGYGFGYPFLDTFVNGQFVGGIYGVGGGYNSRGYYRVNEAMNQIQFTSDVPSETIVLEYIADPINPDGSASVPKNAIEALIAFVNWKVLEYKRGVPLSAAADAERKWNIQFRKLRHINMSFSVAEYMESQSISIHQSVKR